MKWWLALIIDVLLVLVFAAIGMVSHGEPFALGGLSVVAWPFLVGLGIGWVVSLAWRAPAKPLRSGIAIWAVAVVGGMLLRAASGAGTAPSFIVVASIVLFVFLVGWRVIAAIVGVVRRRAAS